MTSLRTSSRRCADGYYFGVVDDEGTVIIAPTRGSIYVGNDNGYIITNKAGRQGAGDFDLQRAGKSEIIDASGKVMLSVDMYLCYYDGFCRVLNDEQKYGFFDTSGRNVTGFVFD
ncbi:MAG: hypothetical protein LBL49_09180, partial [Clostridiales Family XIII bacterium]|nr:hypothetical protein [Clostridiales Family XIII bacterium]